MPNDETELMLIMSLGDANQRCSTPHYTNYWYTLCWMLVSDDSSQSAWLRSIVLQDQCAISIDTVIYFPCSHCQTLCFFPCDKVANVRRMTANAALPV